MMNFYLVYDLSYAAYSLKRLEELTIGLEILAVRWILISKICSIKIHLIIMVGKKIEFTESKVVKRGEQIKAKNGSNIFRN